MKRNHILTLLRQLLVCLALFVAATACNKNNTSSGSGGSGSTITMILANSTNATMFDSAVIRVHLDTVFSGVGPYTVFVPTNSSFANSGITSAMISAMPDSVVRNIILYHTIGASLLSSNFPPGSDNKIVTANGDSVFTTYNNFGLFVNGIQVVAGDVIASNGVLDVVNYVLLPPSGTILQTLQADTAYTFLVAALNTCSSVLNLDSLLAAPGIYTMFAPSNSAFIAAGYPNIAAVTSANPDSLANVLSYHVVPGRSFTCDYSQSQMLPTVNGNTLTMLVNGLSTFQVQGKLNATPSNIVYGNVMARNGVIHGVDQVLLP